MGDFRVTQQTVTTSTIASLQANLAKLQQYQQELSSGQAVNQPSDNPANATASLQYRSDITRTQQYATNAADGLAWLGMADSTLSGMVTSADQARSLLLQGANGTSTVQDRNTLADQVDSLRQGLLSSANTQYLGRPIFGGTTSNAVAYDSTTGAYLGDNGSVNRNVAPSSTVAVNLNGPTVFGPAGSSLFDALGQVSADLRNPANTANLTGPDLNSLDAVIGTMTSAQAVVGARYNRVQDMQTRAQTTLGTLQSGLSSVEDADLPSTITNLQLQQTAYQAALAASAKIIQPSLADFLR